MDLILWRHAEAEDGDGHMTDLERRLTRRGEKQARRVAAWLQGRLAAECRILVSPAVRTCQTADALGTAYEIEPRIAPGASARSLLKAAGWPAATPAVLLVGHQPSLGEAAGLLLDSEYGLSVRKAAVWWFTSRERLGRTDVVLRAVLDPDLM